MKIGLLLFLLVIPVFAETAFDGKLTFTAPAGFRLMTAEEISHKFPSSNAPQVVYTNETLSCSIALTHSKSRLAPDKLSAFMNFLESSLRRQPGLEMTSSERIELAGVGWGRLIFISQAVDQKVRNEMLATPLEGRALLVNLNCTTKDYPSYRKSLDFCRESFRIQ